MTEDREPTDDVRKQLEAAQQSMAKLQKQLEVVLQDAQKELEAARKSMADAKQYIKDGLDVQFKAVGYLLTAHAAGLAGSLTLLKDYQAIPQLKGIGIFIALFGYGFIFAVFAFVSVVVLHQEWLIVFLSGASPLSTTMPRWVHSLAAISCLILLSATVLLVHKFMWL